MNKYNIIAYIINTLILFLISFASTIFSRKYNLTSLITEAFKPKTDLEVDEEIKQESPSNSKLNQETLTQEKELEIGETEIEKESLPESVLMTETRLHQESSVIDEENKIPSIKELIQYKDFWSEVARLFIVILIGFTIIRYVQ
jgi:hypothetical protein